MKFKEPDNRNQFFSLHPKLRAIVTDLDWYCINSFVTEITITSMIRVGDKGVHGDGRGCDVRSWDFTSEQIAELKFYINQKYNYGDGVHVTCFPHGDAEHPPNTGTYHIHLQVRRDGKV
jgi:hypothetical protein